MFPPSPYAHSVGSFQAPVPIVDVEPDAGPLLYVGINPSWFPYIIGSLFQLLLQTTWAYDDLNQLEVQQGRAWNLINLFNISTAKSLDELRGQFGIQWEEAMTAQVRTTCEDGVFKFQVLKCACPEEWVTVAFETGSSQPGAGSPQPQPGGPSVSYQECVSASSTALLPTAVSTGDVIDVRGTTGAWNDPGNDGPIWRCPDGEIFILGACAGGKISVSTDPLPSAPHMALIALVGSVYLDMSAGPVTVPSGITNAQVTFQANDSTLGNNNGTICFAVNVTNSQSGTWRHLLDFAFSPYSFTGFNGDGAGAIANWVPGTGWTGVPGVTTPTNNYCDFVANFASCEIDTLELTYAIGTNSGGSCDLSVFQGATQTTFTISHTAGNPKVDSANVTLPGVTSIRVSLENFGSPAGTNYGFQLKVSGQGADPFPTAPTY